MAAVDTVSGVSGRVFQGDVVLRYLIGDVALLISVTMSTQKGVLIGRLSASPPPIRNPLPLIVTEDIRVHALGRGLAVCKQPQTNQHVQ